MPSTRRTPLSLVAAVLLTSCLPAFAGGHSILITVNGHCGPWNYGNGQINPDYPYGMDDQQSPAIVDASSGFTFQLGSKFTITYIGGLISPGSSYSNYDANGDIAYPFNNLIGPNGTYAPSYYMDPASFPINLVELVGAFADKHGEIVGRPFAIGKGPFTVRAPSGATALQLGINDVIYSDNTGAFIVKVRGQAAADASEE